MIKISELMPKSQGMVSIGARIARNEQTVCIYFWLLYWSCDNKTSVKNISYIEITHFYFHFIFDACPTQTALGEN